MRTILSTIVDPEFAAMVKEEAARRNTSISRLVKESLMTSLMTSKGEERNEKERSKGKVKKGEETERDSRVREEVPPAFVEVEEYAQQSPKIRAALEEQPDMAAKFYDFYQSKGWLVGAAPMKNWKSAFRNWVRRRGEDAAGNRRCRRPLQASRETGKGVCAAQRATAPADPQPDTEKRLKQKGIDMLDVENTKEWQQSTVAYFEALKTLLRLFGCLEAEW